MWDLTDDKKKKNHDLILMTLGNGAENFSKNKKQNLIQPEFNRSDKRKSDEADIEEAKKELGIEHDDKSRRNKYIQIMKKMEDSSYSYSSNASRPKRIIDEKYSLDINGQSSQRSKKGISNNVIKLNKREGASMSTQKARNDAEVPKVASSSTFKAGDLHDARYILSTKNKRNKIMIHDEDLEVQMLNELEESYGDKNGVHIKDGWVAGNLNKDGVPVEDLSEKPQIEVKRTLKPRKSKSKKRKVKEETIELKGSMPSMTPIESIENTQRDNFIDQKDNDNEKEAEVPLYSKRNNEDDNYRFDTEPVFKINEDNYIDRTSFRKKKKSKQTKNKFETQEQVYEENNHHTSQNQATNDSAFYDNIEKLQTNDNRESEQLQTADENFLHIENKPQYRTNSESRNSEESPIFKKKKKKVKKIVKRFDKTSSNNSSKKSINSKRNSLGSSKIIDMIKDEHSNQQEKTEKIDHKHDINSEAIPEPIVEESSPLHEEIDVSPKLKSQSTGSDFNIEANMESSKPAPRIINQVKEYEITKERLPSTDHIMPSENYEIVKPKKKKKKTKRSSLTDDIQNVIENTENVPEITIKATDYDEPSHSPSRNKPVVEPIVADKTGSFGFNMLDFRGTQSSQPQETPTKSIAEPIEEPVKEDLNNFEAVKHTNYDDKTAKTIEKRTKRKLKRKNIHRERADHNMLTQDEYPKIASNIETNTNVQTADNSKGNDGQVEQPIVKPECKIHKKEELKNKIKSENVYQNAFHPQNFDKSEVDSLERDKLPVAELDNLNSNANEFKHTLQKFQPENEYDDLSQPKSRENSNSVTRKKKKKKRAKAYEEPNEIQPDQIPSNINIVQVNKDRRSNTSSLDRSVGKINNPPSAPHLSKSPSPNNENKDDAPDRIWGKAVATPMKIDDPAEEYSPVIKRNQNTERIAKTRDKHNGSLQERTNKHFEDEKISRTEKKQRDNVHTRSVAGHSEYSSSASKPNSYINKNKIGNDKMPRATSKTNSQTREQKINLNTQDYNKFNLESALLKEPYEDRTSNPSSNNTFKTGQRTLGTVINRRLSGAPKMLDRQDSKNINKHRASSNNPQKVDIHSETGIEKFDKYRHQLTSHSKPIKIIKDMGVASAIQQTIDQSRYNQKKFLLAMYDLNGAYDSMRKLIMTPMNKHCGIIQMSVIKNTSGFNKFYPKYILIATLPDGKGKTVDREIMCCKKRAYNRTSNYMISLDVKNPKPKGPSYLGKLRATNSKKNEYLLFDSGENPEKAKANQDIRKAFMLTQFADENIPEIGNVKTTK